MTGKRQNCVALAGIGVHESLVVLVTFSKVHVKLRSHAINLDIVFKAPDEFRSGVGFFSMELVSLHHRNARTGRIRVELKFNR